MNFRCFRIIGVFLLIAASHLFLYSRLADVRRDNGWPTIVMHNWHEQGYRQLDGQLVANPGGLDAGETKYIYPGHRPTFLIFPYLLKELPGAALGDGLLYDFTVLAMTYLALLWLLGTGFRGQLVACVVCLAPGFMSNVSNVDTIGIPALLGVAAMSFAGGSLARKETTLTQRLAAFGVMVLFMPLNWSTLFPLGIAAIYVWCKTAEWKKNAAYFAGALLIGLGVLAVSMHSKHANAANTGDFWNAYLWGPLGYDRAGMTFAKAFVRITAVNLVAWLPLIATGVALLLANGIGPNWRRAPWPLLASIAAVFALRNYNAHHPWNAVCEIGLGLVLSIELLVGAETKIKPLTQKVLAVGAMVFSLGYLVAWLALDEYNGRGMTAVQTLAREHTPRKALLVIADDLLPAGVTDYKPLAEEFDRKVVSLNEWNQRGADPAAGGKEIFLLTHATTPPPDARLVAESRTHATWADQVMIPLFDFYRTKISRRTPGNRKEYFDEYRLYRLAR
jgi:hypothetical protein